MKVCLLNDSFPPVIDGVVNVMQNYAEHLMSDHGAKVMVGTPEYPDASYDTYPYPVIAYPSINTASVTSGYRTGNPFDGKALGEMSAFGPDIIHSHCPASATVIARLLREQTGAPIIFTYHTKYDIDIERFFKVKAAAREGVKAMVSNIEACDDVWVVSRGAGESLKALGYSGDYRVANNGVDFAKGRVDKDTVARVTADYDLPEGVPVFLFVGRMMTYKGIPIILDALHALSEEGMDFRMVFVGKGPDMDLFKQRASELGLMGEGLRDKVIFTGPVYDRDVLRAWNTRADLFLFPSTFDTNGLVVREAAACGLASVLVRGSCAAEGITDGRNGFLIEENAVSMAQLLKEVSGDLSHLHQVGNNAMEEIYLSWESCVNEAYDRYGEILEARRRGTLPEKQKMPSDYLVSMTAEVMGEQEKARRKWEGFFSEIQSAAAGMMDNIQEAEVDAMESWRELAHDMWGSTDLFRDSR